MINFDFQLGQVPSCRSRGAHACGWIHRNARWMNTP